MKEHLKAQNIINELIIKDIVDEDIIERFSKSDIHWASNINSSPKSIKSKNRQTE